MSSSNKGFNDPRSENNQYELFDNESGRDFLCYDIFFKDGPFAIVILDKFFQVTKVNDLFKELFNQSDKDVLGNHIYTLIKSEDALKLKTIFEERNAQHAPLFTKLDFISKNGKFQEVDTFVKKYSNINGEDVYCMLMFDKGFCPDPDWIEMKHEVYKAIVDTQEQERNRIGRQLHDSVAQSLYAIRLGLQHLGLEDKELDKQITPIKKVLNDAIHEVRNVSIDLVPSTLHNFGLKVAIQSMIDRLNMADFKVNSVVPDRVEMLNDDLKTVIYRVVQELLNNVMKHTTANKVKVWIDLNDKQVHIRVIDNGLGFELNLSDSMSKGTGLRTIKNRTDLYQGTIEMSSSDKGSTVEVILKVD